MRKIDLTTGFLFLCMSLNAQVAEKLQAIGMENVRMTEKNGTTTVTFENNVYRGTYRGVGKAIDACLESDVKDNLQVVVLENDIPQICINLPDTLIHAYHNGEVSLAQVYADMGISTDTDNAMEALKGVREERNSSAWKADIVVYPEVFLENSSFNKLYTYAVNLNPAIEMGLWKGSMLTAQVVFPVATNLYGEYKRIRPGIITLAQEFRLKKNVFGRVVAGNFTDNRIGIQMEMKYRTTNGRLELGALVGSTGQSVITDEGWYIGTNQRINAAVKASVYEPRFNLQLDLQAGRYLYGDYGVRGDCTRHFGEYAVGMYAMYIEGEINGGFHFAIPLPGKKWKRNHAVRIKPADYFAWAYSMVSWGEYVNKQLGRSYNTRPDENRSSRFYQPDFIRYFLIKELSKK